MATVVLKGRGLVELKPTTSVSRAGLKVLRCENENQHEAKGEG